MRYSYFHRTHTRRAFSCGARKFKFFQKHRPIHQENLGLLIETVAKLRKITSEHEQRDHIHPYSNSNL